MWGWISDNSEPLNVVLTLAMLAVWVSYFQLLWYTFRQQNRPNILINRGAGEDLDSRCLISNMSAHSIYVEAVQVTLRQGDIIRRHLISDAEKLKQHQSATQAVEYNAQGPLKDGEFVDIGSFGRLAVLAGATRDTSDGKQASIDGLEEIEVTVLAVYTARSDLVGATRRFSIRRSDAGVRLVPQTVLARQITKSAERKALFSSLTAS